MFKTIIYRKWPKVLNFAETIQKIDIAIRQEFRLKRVSSGFRRWDNTFSLAKSSTERYTCDRHTEFMSVISSVPFFDSFAWHSTYASRLSLALMSSKRFGVGIDFNRREVEVAVHADDLGFIERTHEVIRNIMGVENPERVDADGYRRKMLDPTVFVARHFDAVTNQYYWSLASFLQLLDFDVKQGEEYTSDSIPEKIKRRIEQQDITLMVVSGDRDHSWLLTEASYALGLRKHVVILLEQDARIETGLLGKDLEQVRFPVQRIEASYCSLLREFRSVGVKGLFN